MTTNFENNNTNNLPNRGKDEVGEQPLKLKNGVELNLHLAYEYGSKIKSQLVYGRGLPPRKFKGFFETFWYVYNYVEGSVDADQIPEELTRHITMWFDVIPGNYRNSDLVDLGVDLYLKFVKTLQKMGIARLTSESVEPPLMSEDLSDFALLIGKHPNSDRNIGG